MEGQIWQSYRYDAYGNITFGKPEYNNVYGYNAESYNPNLDAIYLRARYYNPTTADFMTEDSYLGNIADPLMLNRYLYVMASPLNYIDPSGNIAQEDFEAAYEEMKIELCGLYQAFMNNFGFSRVITDLIIKVYSGLNVVRDSFEEYRFFTSYLGIKPEYKSFNGIFSKVLGSISYGNSLQFQLVSDLMPVKEVKTLLGKLGLTDSEINTLIEAVDTQHITNGMSYLDISEYVQTRQLDESYKAFSGKSDFTHMFATISTYYVKYNLTTQLFGGLGASMGSISSDPAANAGYAGDIYGFDLDIVVTKPTIGPADYTADLDAVNLYYRASDELNFLSVMEEYYKEIEDDKELRATEFAQNLGGGSYEIGVKKLQDELDKAKRMKKYGFYNFSLNAAEKFVTNILNKADQW